ncbi:glycoside hydrolase family 9 protein [Vibrio coralliilyticus]|uniref:glycoside hydrolase family 9 protein n=1 Tax=Vibrio coralliilyticus TaxID=190893 RepID=UPI001E4E0B8C|nr:glycoside hydrolase family 9 protein [Vibrio coralliilyticus]MCC2523019.1 glycoside hydrolase family 9 protein [Vibrio coralliilyticus]
MLLLTNHIGYESLGPKQAILMADVPNLPSSTALLVCADSHQTVASLDVETGTRVANWHQGYFFRIDFSNVKTLGRYYLKYNSCQSSIFSINQDLLFTSTLSDVLHYFKSQRSSGIYDRQDQNIPLLNSSQTVDVRGGWYDASGDVSKYLSHLSYANYLNPQQIPMVVWNILKGLELCGTSSKLAAFTQLRLKEEALFGADFLVRMQHESGFFYTTVFDKWSKDPEQREICSYATQDGHKSDDFQAGFRQGGGIAIAALAAAARLDIHGDFTTQQYLDAAESGYHHLKELNCHYLNDGEENIIDEYCALMACAELYKTTQNHLYLEESRYWAARLMLRQQSDELTQNFWSANNDGSRPYYHAAEAGLPVIALCLYLEIEDDPQRRQSTVDTITHACQFELSISTKVANPFGYPRQYVKGVNQAKQDAFFIAQDNESGYWWQGENARLASLSVMAYLAQPHLCDVEQKHKLSQFSQNALNWILGLNPYDMCMLDGHGRNNPDYLPHLGFFNAKGGICNGITAGFDDSEDIAFNPVRHKDDMLQNWRWGEQWIPHSAWYLLAIMAQQAHFSRVEEQ